MYVLSFTAWWYWQHRYVFPERAGIASFFQLTVGLSALFYIINYQRISKLRINNIYLKVLRK